jgi:hypothetical protein
MIGRMRFTELKFIEEAADGDHRVISDNSICTSGLHDCYRRCFVVPSGFAFGL